MTGRVRLAYLVTHPIQYQAPLLRRIAGEPDIDFKVFFRSDSSIRGQIDPGFGRRVEWDVPLLEGYDHELLPALGGRSVLAPPWRPLSHGIGRRLRKGRFDALWVHGYAWPYHWLAMATARRLGLAVLLRDEATPISAPRGPVRRIAKRVFFRALERVCDGYLAIGSLNREYYLSQGIADSRIFLVPYAVDNERFRIAAEAAAPGREALRRSLGLDPGRPVVLFVGKLIPVKDPLLLVQALALVARNTPAPPYLVFVGEGELRALIEQTAAQLGLAQSVRLLGFRNQSELPVLYDLCDAFALPSRREPWGLVVNEVMNAGRPVLVSTAVGAGPDLVAEDVNGYRLPPGDAPAWAAAIGRVTTDEALRRGMGAASAARIAEWGFEQDVAGLRRALEATAKRSAMRTAGCAS